MLVFKTCIAKHQWHFLFLVKDKHCNHPHLYLSDNMGLKLEKLNKT